jgi:hypothetical protein
MNSRIYALLALCTLALPWLLSGQSGRMNILVDLPQVTTEADGAEAGALRQILQTRLAPPAGENYFGSLACRATLSRTGTEEISGIAKRQVVRYVLDLRIYDRVLDEALADRSLQLTGSGDTDRAAAQNAVRQLHRRGTELQAFAAEALRAHQASLLSCEKVLARLQTLLDQRAYTQILALTNGLAEDHPCYGAVSGVRDRAYAQRQSAWCNTAIQKAQSALAVADFATASRLLSSIDPRLDCAADVDRLIQDMAARFSERDMKTLDWYLAYKTGELDLQRARTEIISNLVLQNFTDED